MDARRIFLERDEREGSWDALSGEEKNRGLLFDRKYTFPTRVKVGNWRIVLTSGQQEG